MRSPENAFNCDVHQDHIESLEVMGYVVYADGFSHLPEGHPDKYFSLVIPRQDHDQKLTELNNAARISWLKAAEQGYESGYSIPGFLPYQRLPWEEMKKDERFRVHDTAWGALVNSAEAAAYLVDNPAAEH